MGRGSLLIKDSFLMLPAADGYGYSIIVAFYIYQISRNTMRVEMAFTAYQADYLHIIVLRRRNANDPFTYAIYLYVLTNDK